MSAVLSRPSTLLIDTNLFLVLLVGGASREHVERFKRTQTYTAADYDLLVAHVDGFREMLVTPNVLTEVSNLAGQLAEPLRSRVLGGLAAFAGLNAERYIPSRHAVLDADFRRLGLADVSILKAAGEEIEVLTDDLGLYLTLLSHGIPATNFNHIRAIAFG